MVHILSDWDHIDGNDETLFIVLPPKLTTSMPVVNMNENLEKKFKIKGLEVYFYQLE